MTAPRFVKLVGSPLDGLYVKQEQDLRTIVIGFVQGWGELRQESPCRYKVSLGDNGEWVGVFMKWATLNDVVYLCGG